jgi:hypothetical protein
MHCHRNFCHRNFGFVRPLDGKTISWAEFAGNRQYVSIGNTAADDRVATIFMDHARRRRLKLLGRMRVFDAAERPDLAERLATYALRSTLGTRCCAVTSIFRTNIDFLCHHNILSRLASRRWNVPGTDQYLDRVLGLNSPRYGYIFSLSD